MMLEDRLLNLPVILMAICVFAAVYLIAASVFFVVTRLAVDGRARAFKGISPGMLPPLGIIFGLLVGFIAAQVWSDFEKAKFAVSTEASALRATLLLAESFPPEQESRLRALVNAHIEAAVHEEWPAMAKQRATLLNLPKSLIEALQATLAFPAVDDGQKTAQREIVTSLETAMDARRQRIVISQSSVSPIKWVGLLLQALCTFVAIAMVHSDNRPSCAIALTIFATGAAVSILLIASYSRPFTGEISVGPALLQQVIIGEAPSASSP